MREGRGGGAGGSGGGGGGGGSTMFMETNSLSRSSKYSTGLHSDPNIPSTAPIGAGPPEADDDYARKSCASTCSAGYFDGNRMSGESSPYDMSPWNQGSPYSKSPWTRLGPPDGGAFSDDSATFAPSTGLIGSLIREEGHIYSLAAYGDLLYTGSDSKNIRVWKNQKEFSGFKSNSGLVKAIIIAGDRIFTGHQDGKIRVWRVSSKNPAVHRRAGSLPTFKHLLKSSIKPSNYVEVRRHRSALWIRHCDAVSCLSLNEDEGLLYSGSWDKTFKVWRIADSKCQESVRAHDDAVNAVVASVDGIVFTGSADGTVKVWRREMLPKGTKHTAVKTLLKQESAVTALAVSPTASVVYCGSSDGVINFWEREKQLAHGGVLRGHKHAVLCLAAAGSLLLSGSADQNICVWRWEEGAHSCLSVLTGHTGPVKCLAIECDGESPPGDPRWIVYSGSLDKSVKVWSVSEQPAGDNLFFQQQQQQRREQPPAEQQHQEESCSAASSTGGGHDNYML